MKDKKNIDRLFQEKFKDFEKNPKTDMWNKISAELDKKAVPSKGRVIPLWMKLGSIAAVLAIIFAVVLFNDNGELFSNDPEVVFDKPDTETQKDQQKNVKSESGIAEQNQDSETSSSGQETDNAESSSSNKAGQAIAEENPENNSDQKTTTKVHNPEASRAVASNSDQSEENVAPKKNVANNRVQKINSDSAIASRSDATSKGDSKIITEESSSEKVNEKEKFSEMPESNPVDKSGIIAENSETESEKAVIDTTKAGDLNKEESALAENLDGDKEETEEDDLSEAMKKKFQVSTFAAPIFYNNIGSGSELANQFADNSNSTDVTVSIGLKVAYQVSNKFKIRTGVSKMSVNKNIQNIAFTPSALVNQVENISAPGASDNISIINAPSPSGTGPAMPNNSFSTSSSSALAPVIYNPGEIHQEFGFIEVPVELEYAIIDKRFNLNLIGGASGLFLDDNRVSLVTESSSTELGEANNINKTSFSTNVGLGLDYELNDKFSIGVEPVFKYQLNTFSNVNNVQPTNFGIYSGLKIRF